MDIGQLYKIYLEAGRPISIDSRAIEEGQIFFAIKGERFDGNDYVDEVLAKGASCAVVDNIEAFRPRGTILVDDSLTALQSLASYHRKQMEIPVIGITGSNGKTTTKELLHQVLSQKFQVHSTKGNFNNHIGVPLTLLSAPEDTEILIVEMGANHIGEIAMLSNIAEPDLGLITNIGKAHLEGFGSLEGVIEAKTELYRFIKKNDGIIFYNGEDALLNRVLPNGSRTIKYLQGMAFRNEGVYISIQDTSTKSGWLKTSLVGSYNHTNILCAATVGQYFGVSIDKILDAIASYVPTNNRSQLVIRNNIHLLMDAYNANPTSMQESIASFAAQESDKEKVLIIGDMAELGSDSMAMHQEILEFLSCYEWKAVFLVGNQFSNADMGQRYPHYKSVSDLVEDRHTVLSALEGSMCLIKASRSMQLEKIEALI